MSARTRAVLGSLLLAIWFASSAAEAAGSKPAAPEFERDIRPLMERAGLQSGSDRAAGCEAITHGVLDYNRYENR